MVDDISGHVAGSPKGGSGPHCRSCQALGRGPPGEAPIALQMQIQSPHRWHGQAQARPLVAVGGAWDLRVRHGTQRWGRSAAGQAAEGVRRQGTAGEGSEAHERRQAAAKGRGTHSQFDSHWLECWGALGFRGSGLQRHLSSKPSESTRPKPRIGSAADRTQPQR